MSMLKTDIDSFDPYGDKKYFQGAASGFLETNTIVAKLAFLLLVIFIFIILLRIGTALLSYFFSFSTNPILIKGMIDAEKLVVVAQNPNTPGAMPILRSNNERDGLEFTWSVWLWVKNPPLSPLYIQLNGDLVKDAIGFLNRTENPISSRKQWPNSFPDPQFKGRILPEHQLAEGGSALCYWGDPGWGKLVQKGKYQSGSFDQELILESAKLIGRYPEPLKWVCWIKIIQRE